MTQELTIYSIKGTGDKFKVEFIEDNRYCYTEVPFKTITHCLKHTNMCPGDAVEQLITYHRGELTIISLN